MGGIYESLHCYADAQKSGSSGFKNVFKNELIDLRGLMGLGRGMRSTICLRF